MSEESRVLSEIKESRERVQSYYVASIYKNIDFFSRYEVSLNQLDKDSPFTFYYLIAKSMIKKGGYEKLDIVSVDSYVKNNLNESGFKTYKKYGGYDTIEMAMEVVESSNVESYYKDILKYSALIQLYKKGFNIEKNWAEIKELDYRELSDYIQQEYTDVFMNVDLGDDKIVDIKTNIDSMLEEADKGALHGIPYSSRLLTELTNGMRRGEMTILAAKTGEGKSFLSTHMVLPMMVKHDQKLLIMTNEEGIKKWQREILIYLINNFIVKEHEEFQGIKMEKTRFYKGKFSSQEWKLLKLAKERMFEMYKDNQIMFVDFSTFSMDKAIDVVRQYSTKYNIHYYILDTLKLDNDIGSSKTGDLSWLALQQSSVKMFNVIKEENQNAHLLVTYQLNKQNVSRLTMESLGMSRNIADVASTVILTRNLTQKEKQDGGLKIKNAKGQVSLDEEDDYMVLFIPKNRGGASNKEIVIYTDKANNIIKDVGLTTVPEGAMM